MAVLYPNRWGAKQIYLLAMVRRLPPPALTHAYVVSKALYTVVAVLLPGKHANGADFGTSRPFSLLHLILVYVH